MPINSNKEFVVRESRRQNRTIQRMQLCQIARGRGSKQCVHQGVSVLRGAEHWASRSMLGKIIGFDTTPH